MLTYLLTFEVPDAITIGVVEGSRVDLVNNASLPPLQRSFRRHRVAGLGYRETQRTATELNSVGEEAIVPNGHTQKDNSALH